MAGTGACLIAVPVIAPSKTAACHWVAIAETAQLKRWHLSVEAEGIAAPTMTNVELESVVPGTK